MKGLDLLLLDVDAQPGIRRVNQLRGVPFGWRHDEDTVLAELEITGIGVNLAVAERNRECLRHMEKSVMPAWSAGVVLGDSSLHLIEEVRLSGGLGRRHVLPGVRCVVHGRPHSVAVVDSEYSARQKFVPVSAIGKRLDRQVTDQLHRNSHVRSLS